MPTRTLFDNMLAEVRDDLMRLTSMVDAAIANSITGLCDRNESLVRQVIANDATLNALRYQIENQCYKTIALQQPNATDLRVIVGAVSVATNLERMGDHAAGSARLALKIIEQPELKSLVDIPQMAEIGREMVKGSVDAFIRQDAPLAERIVVRDRDMDRLQDQVYHNLIGYMTQDAKTIERATFLLWISHNLERIGDRSMNICERAIFVATGELKEFN